MPAAAARGVAVSVGRKEEAKKRLEDLKQAEADQVAKVKEQVAPYLKMYDVDGSGSLEKPEVMAMLESLAPGLQHPSEAAVDKIIQSVTGHPEVPVTIETLPQLMIMLHDFARHAIFADNMIKKFDVDDSGKLDIEELCAPHCHTRAAPAAAAASHTGTHASPTHSALLARMLGPCCAQATVAEEHSGRGQHGRADGRGRRALYFYAVRPGQRLQTLARRAGAGARVVAGDRPIATGDGRRDGGSDGRCGGGHTSDHGGPGVQSRTTCG